MSDSGIAAHQHITVSSISNNASDIGRFAVWWLLFRTWLIAMATAASHQGTFFPKKQVIEWSALSLE
jgi:hypothetical protein